MTEVTRQQPGYDDTVSPQPNAVDTLGAAATGAFIIGAQRLPDGTLDLSRALYFNGGKEPAAETTPLESVIQEAERVGVPEGTLAQISQMLRTNNKPFDRRITLLHTIERESLDVSAAELLRLTRAFYKETVKSTEKGTLIHYHQTDIDNLGSIIDSGGLLSYDEQKKRGLAPRSSGSRQDVVQMTRDAYDSEGNLRRAGIGADSSGLGASGSSLVFVFGESIMEESDYDCFGEYPNVPSAPLEKLQVVLVNEPTEIPTVRAAFADKGLEMNVMSRSDWLAQYKS